MKILGIGNAIVDVICKVEDKYLSDNELTKSTMKLVDEIEFKKLLSTLKIEETVSGGSVANSIVGLSQLGNEVGFIGKVNDDDLGQKYEDGLKKENVNYLYSKKKELLSTGTCLILITPDSERTMNTYLGVSQELTEEDVDLNIIEESSILYLEGYLWDLDNAKKAIKKSISTAINSETKIAFSISDAFCVDRFREEFIDLVNNSADIIFANESEIKSLFETNELNDAIKKCQDTKKIFALTLGDKGAKIIYKNEIVDIKPEVINKLVDTTGAGDLFAAGFLHGFINNFSTEESLLKGTEMSSKIIQKIGARLS